MYTSPVSSTVTSTVAPNPVTSVKITVVETVIETITAATAAINSRTVTTVNSYSLTTTPLYHHVYGCFENSKD